MRKQRPRASCHVKPKLGAHGCYVCSKAWPRRVLQCPVSPESGVVPFNNKFCEIPGNYLKILRPRAPEKLWAPSLGFTDLNLGNCVRLAFCNALVLNSIPFCFLHTFIFPTDYFFLINFFILDIFDSFLKYFI